jgi:hypothetical protein
MDTALAMPPWLPSLLVRRRLCFAACLHTRCGEEGFPIGKHGHHDYALHKVSLVNGPWPDVTAAWCRIDNETGTCQPPAGCVLRCSEHGRVTSEVLSMAECMRWPGGAVGRFVSWVPDAGDFWAQHGGCDWQPAGGVFNGKPSPRHLSRRFMPAPAPQNLSTG